ncbi:MAG: glycosyl hydrolase [Acholeplasmataceae bacterium]|nr:MAG: glycosyl hydrolase [Acholeplasmataceae bacterium]
MIPYGRAICYSGYRQGQSPITGVYPSYEEVLADLLMLEPHFDYIRMYDVSLHAKTVLDVLKKEGIALKVMLGVEPKGEISNPGCPWGGLHSEEAIASHKISNYAQLDQMIDLCNAYEDVVLAVSVGNESTSDWHPNLMDPKTLADHIRYVKARVNRPVTFCEGAGFWLTKGAPIAEAADFLSIHSYPLWHRISFDQAVTATIKDYEDNRQAYPDKPILFTEFGWTTKANEKMNRHETDEAHQKRYLDEVLAWSETNKVTMFIFEAFDEPWKGSDDPDEPEKHWGIWTVDRTPKLFFKTWINK